MIVSNTVIQDMLRRLAILERDSVQLRSGDVVPGTGGLTPSVQFGGAPDPHTGLRALTEVVDEERIFALTRRGGDNPLVLGSAGGYSPDLDEYLSRVSAFSGYGPLQWTAVVGSFGVSAGYNNYNWNTGFTTLIAGVLNMFTPAQGGDGNSWFAGSYVSGSYVVGWTRAPSSLTCQISGLAIGL